MQVERLNVEIPDVRFEVKDNNLYYIDTRKEIIETNLTTKEQTVYEILNYPDNCEVTLTRRKNELCVQFWVKTRNEMKFAELELNPSEKTAQLVNETSIEGDFKDWTSVDYRSQCVSANYDYTQFYDCKNDRFYSDLWLSKRHPVFAYNGLLHYVTKEGGYYLNTLNTNDSKTKEQLIELNDVRLLCKERVNICLFGETAFLLQNTTRQQFSNWIFNLTR